MSGGDLKHDAPSAMDGSGIAPSHSAIPAEAKNEEFCTCDNSPRESLTDIDTVIIGNDLVRLFNLIDVKPPKDIAELAERLEQHGCESLTEEQKFTICTGISKLFNSFGKKAHPRILEIAALNRKNLRKLIPSVASGDAASSALGGSE